MSQMRFEDLELFYERLAAAIDTAGPNNEAVMLTKLALLLAHKLGDSEAALAAIDSALHDLDAPAPEASEAP